MAARLRNEEQAISWGLRNDTSFLCPNTSECVVCAVFVCIACKGRSRYDPTPTLSSRLRNFGSRTRLPLDVVFIAVFLLRLSTV